MSNKCSVAGCKSKEFYESCPYICKHHKNEQVKARQGLKTKRIEDLQKENETLQLKSNKYQKRYKKLKRQIAVVFEEIDSTSPEVYEKLKRLVDSN